VIVDVTSGGGVVSAELEGDGATVLVGELPSSGVHARHVSPTGHEPPPEQQ
jgi:hypothetical protein